MSAECARVIAAATLFLSLAAPSAARAGRRAWHAVAASGPSLVGIPVQLRELGADCGRPARTPRGDRAVTGPTGRSSAPWFAHFRGSAARADVLD